MFCIINIYLLMNWYRMFHTAIIDTLFRNKHRIVSNFTIIMYMDQNKWTINIRQNNKF